MPGVGVPAEGMLVGGGQEQARLALEAAELAQQGELARMGMGQQLLSHLADIQGDPFSIVTALKGYGAAGGGTLAPAADLYASGGRGRPSQYGAIYDQILTRLGGIAGAGGAPGGGAEVAKPGKSVIDVVPGGGVGAPVLQSVTPSQGRSKRKGKRTAPLYPKTDNRLTTGWGRPSLTGIATLAGLR